MGEGAEGGGQAREDEGAKVLEVADFVSLGGREGGGGCCVLR